MANNSQVREYETIYIMRPDLDDNQAAEVMLAQKNLIEKLGGKTIKIEALSRKKLCWERKKQSRGIFVHHYFVGKPGISKDFDSALSIHDKILTRQTVVLKHNVDMDSVVIQEDSLVPPIYKERRDFGDKRSHKSSGFYDRDDDFSDRSFGNNYDDYEDDN